MRDRQSSIPHWLMMMTDPSTSASPEPEYGSRVTSPAAVVPTGSEFAKRISGKRKHAINGGNMKENKRMVRCSESRRADGRTGIIAQQGTARDNPHITVSAKDGRKWNLPTVPQPDLLERIAEKDNLLQAILETKKTTDSSAGVDGRTVAEVCCQLLTDDAELHKLSSLLVEGRYIPGPVRRVMIPKHGGQGERPIGIANVCDRIVQRAILGKLDELLIGSWSPHSYAFHEGSDLTDALREVDRARTDGYSRTICIDLKSFFDNVPHDRLLLKLRESVQDQRVVDLITRFLKVSVKLPSGEMLECGAIGTPQGSVLSPWLASDLYLDELDQQLTRRGHRFVRYADDCVIFCRSQSAAKRVMRCITQFITETMCCPVNTDKTVIVPTDDLEYLGVHRRHDHWNISEEKLKEFRTEYVTKLASLRHLPMSERGPKMTAMSCGFVGHYRRIQGINGSQVDDVQRWCDDQLKQAISMPYPSNDDRARIVTGAGLSSAMRC